MTRRKRAADRRMRFVAAALIALIAASIGLYRWLDSEAGRAFLLDAGLTGRYDGVQRVIEGALYEGLVAAGVERTAIRFEREKGTPGNLPVIHVRADVPDGFPLVLANDEIDGRLRGAGGRVRSCAERDGGRSITMHLGTRRVTTHICTVRKRKSAVEPASAARPCIALIVDDFGFFFNSLVRDFLEIEVPLTLSVIPGLKHSARTCRAAAEAGKEVICHMPMEPKQEAEDSGDIPLVRVAMTDGEIEHIIEEALGTVPGVSGMNNHMGSMATEDRRIMKAVLRVCVDRGLYFVDSRTTNRSVVEEVAGSVGAESLGNDIFLDNKGEDTRENMRKLLSIAKRRGEALGIMHVRKDSLADLRWMIGEARRMGIEFVSVSGLIGRKTLALSKGGRS